MVVDLLFIVRRESPYLFRYLLIRRRVRGRRLLYKLPGLIPR